MEFAEAYIRSHSFQYVIAVDAALKKAHQLGLAVQAAVGDFDTLGKEDLARYQKENGITWDIHKPEKDETDTELAVYTAL